MSVKMYVDVNILLTLDFQQPILLNKCLQFVDGIKQFNLECYQLSTVKETRELIIKEINDAVGNSLRGLWHHICMSKGGGVPFKLEHAVLTKDDETSFRRLFRYKRDNQNRNLAKDEIQRQEVWAIEKFRNRLKSQNEVSVMDFLLEISRQLSEVYVEKKNNILRTNDELNLIDEKILNPSKKEVDRVYKKLLKLGLDDWEDSTHIAALKKISQKENITPLFATADRKLSDLGPEIHNDMGLVIEDALYAIDTYRRLSRQE